VKSAVESAPTADKAVPQVATPATVKVATTEQTVEISSKVSEPAAAKSDISSKVTEEASLLPARPSRSAISSAVNDVAKSVANNVVNSVNSKLLRQTAGIGKSEIKKIIYTFIKSPVSEVRGQPKSSVKAAVKSTAKQAKPVEAAKPVSIKPESTKPVSVKFVTETKTYTHKATEAVSGKPVAAAKTASTSAVAAAPALKESIQSKKQKTVTQGIRLSNH